MRADFSAVVIKAMLAVAFLFFCLCGVVGASLALMFFALIIWGVY